MKQRNLVTQYMEEQFDFGGTMMTRGAIIAELQKIEGATQRMIDAYLMGMDLRKRLDARKATS
jgi:hypothetical protein